MKIRSDFVTNSSSSSYLYVSIESKMLVDIVNKYKSLFEENEWFECLTMSETTIDISLGDEPCYPTDMQSVSSVEDVIWTLMCFLTDSEERCGFERRKNKNEAVSELSAEITANMDAIKESIVNARWNNGQMFWEEFYDEFSEDCDEIIPDCVDKPYSNFEYKKGDSDKKSKTVKKARSNKM